MSNVFGAFGGVSYGSLGIPLWVRSIAQAASGSHPSSLVCDVRAIFVYRFDPSCPLSPCLFGVWQRLTCCGEAAWRVWPPLPGRGRRRDSRGDLTVGTASGPWPSERRSGCPRGSFFLLLFQEPPPSRRATPVATVAAIHERVRWARARARRIPGAGCRCDVPAPLPSPLVIYRQTLALRAAL